MSFEPGKKVIVAREAAGDFPTYGLLSSDIGKLTGVLIALDKPNLTPEDRRVWKIQVTETEPAQYVFVPEAMLDILP